MGKVAGNYLVLVLALGQLAACDKAQVVETTNGLVVEFDALGVQKLQEVSWKVGGEKVKQEVSKGFVASIELPALGKQDLALLYQKRQVDAWIVRVERELLRQGRQFIGHFMVPFRVQTRASNTVSSMAMARFRSYYAAASMSLRFERFACPAFGHNLKLTSFTVNGPSAARETLVVQRKSKVVGRVESAGFVPLAFNGGMSLKGNYLVSIALYNSAAKMLMSEYLPIREVISITGEQPVALKGCHGVMIPTPEKSQEHSLKDIKFK